MKVSFRKFVAGAKPHAVAPKFAKNDVLTELNILDNGNGTLTVMGTTQAGNLVDIKDVATITVASKDTTLLTVDTPILTTHGYKAVGPLGSTSLDYVTTWNDGSIGPFPANLPATIQAGPVTGTAVVAVFGPPVVTP